MKIIGVPLKDAVHFILARDNDCVFITRDKHFHELAGHIVIKKPEELI